MSANPEKNYEIGLLLDLYGALLTERQRDLLDYYYNDDLSLSEVSEECGISRQGVRDALIKAEALLTQYEKALGLLEKQKIRRRRFEELLREIDALSESEEKERIKALVKELQEQ